MFITPLSILFVCLLGLYLANRASAPAGVLADIVDIGIVCATPADIVDIGIPADIVDIGIVGRCGRCACRCADIVDIGVVCAYSLRRY